ncbi:Ig-like domain-containing protein [Leptospira santarosai]|uniref:Ig-like domain-containing protein n=1 Tax=Leptospira santarosai TaxID=28183 RepID=UPI000959C86C|nr:Ig-like domain-containing protein [Leptospira santarosai]OLY59307.1 Ig-like protein [Leptospira santarosai serovar Guaricura]
MKQNRQFEYSVFFIIVFCLSSFLIGCSKLENKFKNWIPLDNNPASPKVVYSIPSPGQTGVLRDQKIVMTFNKPIDEQSCIGAFSVQPGVTGLFEINGSTLTFTPNKRWQGGITYLVNLSNRCEDQEGRDLEKPYSISFSVSTDVLPPDVTSIGGRKNTTGCLNTDPILDFVNFRNNFYSTTDVCVNTPIVVNFTKPMDRGTVESNFLTVPQMVGSFVWSNNNTVLTFTPRDVLTTGLTYVLTISQTAQDTSENPLGKNVSASFTVGTEIVKPQILMQDGYIQNAAGCSPGVLASTLFPGGLFNAVGLCTGIVPGFQSSPIIIDFSEAMNLTTTDSNVNISPNINGIKTWSASPNGACGSTGPCGTTSRFTFTPVTPWQHSVTYTVAVSGNSTDIAGNPVGQNYSFSFTVGQDFQIPRVIFQDGFINTGAGCAPGTLASLLDPINGLRDKTGVCSGLSPASANTPIFVHFSESMIQSTIENALSISPNILGTKTWLTSGNALCGSTGPCGNGSLLVFTPSQDWQNTTYTFSIPGSAMDLDGNTLGSSYSFSFTFGIDLLPPRMDFTTGPLLSDLAPACGNLGLTAIPNLTTNICNQTNGTKFRVRFNEPMDQAATTNAFSLSPSVAGLLTWPSPTELLFTPSQNLNLFAQYKLTISTAAKDLAGNAMVSEFISFFTTGNGGPVNNTPPTVLNVLSDVATGPGGCDGGMDDSLSASFVTNVCTDNVGTGQGASFEIIFSKNMNQNVTSQSFSISPNVSGLISWTSPTTLRFIAAQSLNPNTQYVISINQNATDSGGIQIQNGYVLYFLSSPLGGFPAVNSIDVFSGTPTNCQAGLGIVTNILAATVNNACTGNAAVNPIVITFSEPMNSSSLRSGFSISPAVTGQFSFPTANQMIFTPDVAFQYGKRYNLSLATSVTNTSGKGLKNPVNATFVVGALDSSQPIAAGIDFEIDGDGDNCGAVPNDVLNAQSGTLTNNVCTGIPIVIHFNEPMDPASTQSALSVSPSANFAITFAGNDMTLTPLIALNGKQNYTLTISTSAKDLAGNSLQNSFSLIFKTENNSPQVTAIGRGNQVNCNSLAVTTGCWWQTGTPFLPASSYSFTPGLQACPADSTSDNIVIVFNQPMNTVSTVNAVTITAVSQVPNSASSIYKGKWTWSDSDRVLTISMTDAGLACGFDILFNTGIGGANYPLYLIQIDQSATNANGTALSSQFSFFFESN